VDPKKCLLDFAIEIPNLDTVISDRDSEVLLCYILEAFGNRCPNAWSRSELEVYRKKIQCSIDEK
jgi:hypothetical protein